jgi:hypothetical protein
VLDLEAFKALCGILHGTLKIRLVVLPPPSFKLGPPHSQISKWIVVSSI